MSESKEYLVTILHQHPGVDLFASVGKLDATDPEDAFTRSEFWRAKKHREQGCNLAGRYCVEDVRKAYTGLKSTTLALSAEDIDPAA